MAPTPQPQPTSATDLLAQLNSQVDGTKKTAGGDLYGLGDWGSQTVNPGDLPVTVNIAAAGSNTTADDVVKAFASGSADQVATIQHALLMGGFYPTSYTPRWGVIGPEDVSAFAQAVKTAGQAGAPVSGLLEQRAAYGAAAGIAAAQQQNTTAKTAVITLPNEQDLEAQAMAAFQKVLGHKATPKEAAQFAAMYRAMSAGMQRQANQAEYNTATGLPLSGPLATTDPASAVLGAIQTPAANDQPVQPGGGPRFAQMGLGGADAAAMPKPFADQVGGLMSLGQAVAAGSAQPGGLTQISENTPESPAVAAENYARATHPNEAAAADTADTFQTFLNILSHNFG